MKFNLTESERERILNLHMDKGYRKPINEDLLPSDFDTSQPHKAEDFVEMDAYGDEVVLYFNNEETETFHLDLKTHFSAGEPSSYDSPGYDDTLEVEIVGVKQIEPIKKSWEPRQFEDYLQSLGCLDKLMEKLHDEDAYNSAADRHYDGGYDEDAHRDRDLDEDYDVKGNAAQMYDMEKNKMQRALNELDENIKKGDTEMSLHLTFVLRHLLRRIDEFVTDLKK